jgi:diguanylate cyclase (GGDEF)-like protein
MSFAAAVTALVLLGVIAIQRHQVAGLRARLSDATRRDRLTGLLNRPAFEEQVDAELERSRRAGRPLSVVVGDIDALGALNAERGHRAGDAALKLAARDMLKWKRRSDSVGRIGGEEFALLVPEADERGAFLVAERLRRAAHRSFRDESLEVTISFGVASYPDHGEARDLLMSAATRALAVAKERGRDRTVIYSAEVARMLDAGDRSEGTDLQLAAVVNLAEAIDIRDNGTIAHCHTVGRYAELVAQELGMPPEHVERIRMAGLLHDVGKIGISDLILAKPGPLDVEDWREVRRHPEIAGRLLSHAEFDDLRTWVLAHHERPDGKGYPNGLVDDDIPLEGKILAVADAYEAMTTDRPYRPAMSEEAARAELLDCTGTQFDAQIVSVFLTALSHSADTALSKAS